MNTPQELTLCDRCHGESPNHETWCPTVVGANTDGDNPPTNLDHEHEQRMGPQWQ